MVLSIGCWTQILQISRLEPENNKFPLKSIRFQGLIFRSSTWTFSGCILYGMVGWCLPFPSIWSWKSTSSDPGFGILFVGRHTVDDGSEIRLSPVEVGSSSPYLQSFWHPRWCRIFFHQLYHVTCFFWPCANHFHYTCKSESFFCELPRWIEKKHQGQFIRISWLSNDFISQYQDVIISNFIICKSVILISS